MYRDTKGRVIRKSEELRRIKHLAIPPAWSEVWISPKENGHIQATGRDARGRKQYRYHDEWRTVRDGNKYDRMLAFGRALPKIRNRVARDLRKKGMPKSKVLATIVRLLESTCIRVGNEEYARDNQSYGLTTMRNRHAKVRREKVSFEFRGKSGKHHKIDVRDRRLGKIVKKCQELPGQELFCYIDEEEQVQDVRSEDVNAYLREISGADFTAKDFRTWNGTVLAAIALREFEEFLSAKEAKANIVKAIEAVAKLMGNTPSVCRKCYVHPVILQSYLDGVTIRTMKERAEQILSRGLSRLKPDEAAVMMLLRQTLKRRKQGSNGPRRSR